MRFETLLSRKKVEPAVPLKIQIRFKLPLALLGILLVTAVFLPDRAWNTLLVGVGGLFIVAFVWTLIMGTPVAVARFSIDEAVSKTRAKLDSSFSVTTRARQRDRSRHRPRNSRERPDGGVFPILAA